MARRPSALPSALSVVLATLGAGLATLVPSAGHAQAERAELVFEAVEGCPGETVLVLEVERILERSWDELPSELSIAIRIARPEDAGVFVLEIALGEGTRTLRDVQCDALVHAAALIVALAVDADRAILGAAAPPPPPPPLPPPPPPLPEPTGRSLGSPFDPRPRLGPPPLLGIGVGVQVDIGLLPQPSAGPVLEGILRLGSFDARLRVGYVAPSTVRGADGIGAEASAVVTAAHLCVRPLLDPRLAVCGGVDGGAILAQALGPVSRPAPGVQAGPWLAVGAGLWLPWTPWDALDVELSIEGFVSLLRPTFGIDGVGTVFEPFVAGARIGLLIHLDLRP